MVKLTVDINLLRTRGNDTGGGKVVEWAREKEVCVRGVECSDFEVLVSSRVIMFDRAGEAVQTVLSS